MEQFVDKESGCDGALNSATNVFGLTSTSAERSPQEDMRWYSFLRHISNGSQRPDTGVSTPCMNSVP
jgi:hypothetical protein